MLLLLEKEEEETRAETTHLSNFDSNCKGAALGVPSSSVCTRVQFLELDCANEASRRRRRVWRPSESMRNEGIMHPFTISHRRCHGIWPRSGRGGKLGAELLKVERQRAKLNSRESLAESVKRIGRLESSSLVVTRLGRTCDECAAFSRCYRAQRGKRNPPETGSLNQEARDKRIFLFEETGLAVFEARALWKGAEREGGDTCCSWNLFFFFLSFWG